MLSEAKLVRVGSSRAITLPAKELRRLEVLAKNKNKTLTYYRGIIRDRKDKAVWVIYPYIDGKPVRYLDIMGMDKL